ncbi:hypothetical protein NDU88_005661 [Pleurodeles waltl]|uniref:Uncharacterized protein n=1 Tax=Pleurodeles waltl TaxID=8319 RepID=A0AAV7NPN6_PLEWA|nr:hypothetical protein NDU88_005661 [Pleurodeles waltl]
MHMRFPRNAEGKESHVVTLRRFTTFFQYFPVRMLWASLFFVLRPRLSRYHRRCLRRSRVVARQVALIATIRFNDHTVRFIS